MLPYVSYIFPTSKGSSVWTREISEVRVGVSLL